MKTSLQISAIPKLQGASGEIYQAEGVRLASLVRTLGISPDTFLAALALIRFEREGLAPSAWSAGRLALLLLQDPDAEPADAERVTAMLESIYKS